MKGWLAFGFAVFFTPLVFSADSPEGIWTTIDDETKQKRVVVNIAVSGGSLIGTIEKVYPQPGDSNICGKCPGNFKNQPIQKLQFIWGLKDKGNGVWDNGHILDPKNGKVYDAKMTVAGDKLYVRGYIGLSILGRTQTWIKEKTT